MFTVSYTNKNQIIPCTYPFYMKFRLLTLFAFFPDLGVIFMDSRDAHIDTTFHKGTELRAFTVTDLGNKP